MLRETGVVVQNIVSITVGDKVPGPTNFTGLKPMTNYSIICTNVDNRNISAFKDFRTLQSKDTNYIQYVIYHAK